MEEVRIGGASVRVLLVVRGLPSGGPAVAAAISSLSPTIVGLSIAPEEVAALRAYEGGPVPAEGFEEEVYVAGLSAWEAPVKPPPCFTEALRAAEGRGIPVEGLDLDEQSYTEAFTKYVSTMELILRGRTEARLRRKRFRAQTPEAFVVEWDAVVNRAPGYARIEREREAHMASRLRALAAPGGTVLAVIEVERAKGVLAALRD